MTRIGPEFQLSVNDVIVTYSNNSPDLCWLGIVLKLDYTLAYGIQFLLRFTKDCTVVNMIEPYLILDVHKITDENFETYYLGNLSLDESPNPDNINKIIEVIKSSEETVNANS